MTSIAALCGAIVLVVVAVPQLRWRVHVVLLSAAGGIPDIELGDVIRYMRPGSDQTMSFLLDTPNPFAVIRNVRTSAADLQAGAALYLERCASCHGPDGAGGPLAPALIGRAFTHGSSDWAVFRTLRYGVANTAMQPVPGLAEEQRWQVISFLRYLDVPPNSDIVEVARPKTTPLPYDELKSLAAPAEDWPMYSGSYSSQRHSALTQIDDTNVAGLSVRWIHQFEGRPTIEASPVVRNGVMFVSIPPCSVEALDARSGKTLWTWHCTLANSSSGETGSPVNRGVALLDDKVFVTTWDARLFALNAETGAEVWRSTVAADAETYFISSGPMTLDGLVVTGVATRRVGQGFIAAFDAKTGKERWRFVAIPGPGQPGHETWSGDSWKVGGAPTWLTGAYDPELDLLYWGVGNPKPDYDSSSRTGDNLYTNSVVALRGKTGELAWHFQFTPADDKDWDSNQIPVLVDQTAPDGSLGKYLLWANRNGFYYVLDRSTGEFLHGSAFVQQNWNAGLDAKGRPIELPKSEKRQEGALLFPGNVGGTSWWSPTYYPARQLMIVPVLEQGMVFFPSFDSPPKGSGRSFYTSVRALNSSTGDLVWEYRRPLRTIDNHMAGTVSTDGKLVFGSDQSTFFALSAESGKLLWSIETGGAIVAAPITFSVGGRQFVTIAAGTDLITHALPVAANDSSAAR
jgi:alcohol dehydrogenase (cytochrome c)